MSHKCLTQRTTGLTQGAMQSGPIKVRIKSPPAGNNSGASKVYTK